MKQWPRWLPECCLLLIYALLETVWAAAGTARFPVGPAYLPAAVLAVLIVAWATHRFSRWRLLAPVLLPLAMAAVLGAKFYVVTGPRLSGLLPMGVVVLAPPIVFVLRRWFRSTSVDRSAWGVLIGFSVILSTDVPKVLWLQTTGGGTFRPAWALAAFLLMGAGLWLFLASWPFVRRGLLGHPQTTLAASVLAVLFVGGYWTVRSFTAVRTDVPPSMDLSRVETEGVSPERLPNIVLISIDTLRWDMVPPRAEGHELPHLAALRKDSITFDHAFSETSWTLPAHVSLFTGLLPVRHGVQLPDHRIDPSMTLFPEVFRVLGYRTAAMTGGGYLSRKYGYDRGFDVYWQHTEKMKFLRHRDFTPGVLEGLVWFQTLFASGPNLEWRHQFQSGVGEPLERYFEPNLRVARKWLTHREEPSSQFFLFLHTYEVHDANLNFDSKLKKLQRDRPALARALVHDTPLAGAPPLSDTAWHRFASDLPADMSAAARRNFKGMMRRIGPGVRATFRQYLSDLSPQERREVQLEFSEADMEAFRRFKRQPLSVRKRFVRRTIREIYDPVRKRRLARKRIYGYGVESVDESLGDFLGWMKQRDLYRDSLIVFLSDHGDGFELISRVRGHGKGSLSEVLTRVPLWVKLPDNRSAGTSISRPVQLRDLFPVLLEHLGVRVPCAGGARVPCPRRELRDADPLPVPTRRHVRTSIAYQIPSNEERSDTDKRIKLGVRDRDYKRIHPAHGDTDLYWRVFAENLRQESVRPADIPPDRRDRLRRLMERYRRIGDRAPNPFLRGRELDQSLRRELEGLGYF